VTASATTGKDVANLAGSSRDNSLVGSFNGTTATGTLSGHSDAGKQYSVRAANFEQVRANGVSGGTNTARLTDSALVDLLYLDGTLARLTDLNAGIGLWADKFGTVQATLSSKSDKVQIQDPVAFLYTVNQPK
jgi:hypothetical protein